MRIESGALIKANLEFKRKLDIAIKALKFYEQGQHYDTIHVDGDPPHIKRSRILDNGGVAEDALSQINDHLSKEK